MDAFEPPAVQRVVLLGFGDFERHALASYLRLTAKRVPSFRQVETLADADFVIADADDPAVVAAIRAARRAGDTVFIGLVAPDGALGWTMRPIDPLQVFRELGAAVAMRHLPVAAVARPAQDSQRGGLDSQTGALDSGSGSLDSQSGALDSGSGALDAGERGARRAGDAVAPPLALLVDDSDIALRFLQRQLNALGLRTECAPHSARALELLAQQRYDVVFLDVDLGPASELNGLSLCQHLKRQRRDAEPRPTRLIIVSAHASATDRVRGTFAGCDGYLAKPLDDEELRRLLRGLGLLSGPDPSRPRRWRDGVPTSGPIPLSGSG
jgi:CheY-like chemotaxis protein